MRLGFGASWQGGAGALVFFPKSSLRYGLLGEFPSGIDASNSLLLHLLDAYLAHNQKEQGRRPHHVTQDSAK